MSNFSAARGNFQDQAAHMADQASEALRKGTERVTERVQAESDAATKRVRGEVAKHPISALAATLAIGAIAGYLIARR